MTVIKKALEVPYTTEQMFEIISAVEHYPEFVSWCKKTIIQSRNPHTQTATVYGHKIGISFAFTMVNQLQANRMIDIHLMNTGPFRQLKAAWRFEMAENGRSRFIFELQFEFINRFLGWTITPIIKNEASNLMQEFRQRAKALYG
jgi:ribosome-associated toxin RatA of RatAB toxin-antitoxin module